MATKAELEQELESANARAAAAEARLADDGDSDAQEIADEAEARADAAEQRVVALEKLLKESPRGVEAPAAAVSGTDKRIQQLEAAMRGAGVTIPPATHQGPIREMTVRATARGHYGRLRDPGDPTFRITSDKFSPSWMEEVVPEELTDADKVAMAREQASDQAAAIQAGAPD